MRLGKQDGMAKKFQAVTAQRALHAWAAERLKALLQQKNLSQAEIGRELARRDRERHDLHLTGSALDKHTKRFVDRMYSWTTGKVEHPRGRIMADLCQILGVEPGYFVPDDDSATQPNVKFNIDHLPPNRPNVATRVRREALPIRGRSVDAREGRLSFSDDDIVGMADAPADIADVPGAYAVYVTGDSMMPVYRAGFVLLVNPYLPPNPQDDVVIQVRAADGSIEGYVKRLISIDDKYVTASQFNPSRLRKFPRDKVVAIHTVVYGKRR
jgi:phage repressor protein C with HTH and peptisase S24 domain